MCRAALAGELATARAINDRLLPLHRRLFVEANPIPVKWALAQMGKIAQRAAAAARSAVFAVQRHAPRRAARGGLSFVMHGYPMDAVNFLDGLRRVAAVCATARRRDGARRLRNVRRRHDESRQAHRLQVDRHGAGARDPAGPDDAALRRPLQRRPRRAALRPSRRGRPKQSDLLPQNADARIVRAGNERWLVVKATPEQTWSTVRQFWNDLGFVARGRAADDRRDGNRLGREPRRDPDGPGADGRSASTSTSSTRRTSATSSARASSAAPSPAPSRSICRIAAWSRCRRRRSTIRRRPRSRGR